MILTFTVLSQPLPKQSTRFANGHTFTEPRITAWQTKVAWGAKQAMQDAGCDIFTGPIVLKMEFYRLGNQKVDLDNLNKSVMDAMNGIVYVDDSQVVRLILSKYLGSNTPRVNVEVWG